MMPKNHPTLTAEWRKNIGLAHIDHGHYAGGKKSPTYSSWADMVYRCKKHPNWAGRGITVCERWLKFENFLADMGERLAGTTLDRIDNDGNYEPGNCRWATAEEQRRNRRDSRLTLADVAWVRANAGRITQRQMAARLSVSTSAISHIVTGRSYQ